MKKILFVFAAFLLIGVSVAKADNDKVINKNQLPAQAQQFINEHFANVKLSYAKLERDFLERSYEVLLTDGTKLEFSSKGTWLEVDCKYGEVPAAVIPAPIKNYIKENYPGERVLKIERDRSNYELKLSNRLELTFDKDFRIIDIDD
ncbi:MAG: PepSY-like domain-containing protein [Bacteroidales bacterium]|nr:PepSY-like domain-containing protein [Bacteroidales bacterium]